MLQNKIWLESPSHVIDFNYNYIKCLESFLLWPKIEFHHYDHQGWSTMLLSPWEMDNRNLNYKTIYLTSRCSIIHFITHLVTPIPDWCWFLWTLPPTNPPLNLLWQHKPTKKRILKEFYYRIIPWQEWPCIVSSMCYH